MLIPVGGPAWLWLWYCTLVTLPARSPLFYSGLAQCGHVNLVLLTASNSSTNSGFNNITFIRTCVHVNIVKFLVILQIKDASETWYKTKTDGQVWQGQVLWPASHRAVDVGVSLQWKCSHLESWIPTTCQKLWSLWTSSPSCNICSQEELGSDRIWWYAGQWWKIFVLRLGRPFNISPWPGSCVQLQHSWETTCFWCPFWLCQVHCSSSNTTFHPHKQW